LPFAAIEYIFAAGHQTETGDMPHLTNTLVKNLPIPSAQKKTLTSDDEVPRLKMQVTRDGARSWVTRYSVNGHERLMTIGPFPQWQAAEARKEALQLVDQGVDPLAQRISAREAPTVSDLAKRFADEHVPTKRASYKRANEIMLRRWILPELGKLKVANVRPADVAGLHHKVTKSGARIMANRVLACLSKMFALAVRWDMRPDNLCRGAVDRNPETHRRRYLRPEEFTRLADALKAYSDQTSANAVRLISLTGCRRSEALSATWDQFDPGFETWSKPASSTKQGRPHDPPMSAPVRALLVNMSAQATGPFLFPDRAGQGHLTSLRSCWAALCKTAGIENIRIHDLRHSFAAIAVSRGATLPMVSALLGHSSPAVTSRYAHLYVDPLRSVADSVGAVIMGTDKPAEIMPMGGRR
jgi:integrase